MRLTIVIAAVLAATFLTSCGTTPPPQIQYIPKTKVLMIPTEYKSTVAVPQPPFTPQEYELMSVDKREDVLFEYAGSLIYQLGNVNKQIKKLEEWERRQRLLYPFVSDEAPPKVDAPYVPQLTIH